MAKAIDDSTVSFTSNGKTTGPVPIDTMRKAVDEVLANKAGMDLLDSLDSRKEEINGHLHRIIDHAVSNPDCKPGKVTLQITAVSDKGDVIVEAKIKSVIPNEIDGIFQIAKISRDDGQLTLFD